MLPFLLLSTDFLSIYFLLHLFLISLPYSASFVFPLLLFPFYLLGTLPETAFFHFFTISLFLFSLPYSASLVFPLLFVPFYLLGSLPETVFFTFLHSYVCTCLEFYHGLTHPVLFLYFFSFPLLGTLSETFFFYFIATLLHTYMLGILPGTVLFPHFYPCQ